jgi:ABC-2 type transport system ATP-binding protein
MDGQGRNGNEPGEVSYQSIVAARDFHLRVECGEIYGLLQAERLGQDHDLENYSRPCFAYARASRNFRTRHFTGGRSRGAPLFARESVFYKFLIGEETLGFFGKLCRLHSPRLDQRVRELLELVSLTNARYQRLSTYSKEMLQRIDLAQALINQRSWLCSMNQPAGADLSARHICDLIVDLSIR